jgi:hypothetical protein
VDAGRGARTLQASLAAAGLAAACASSAGTYATGPGSLTADGLRRVRWSEHGAEFLRPGADFSDYRQVLLDPLSISTAQGERPSLGAVRQYAPTPDYLDGLRSTFQEAFASEFGGRGTSLASAPGPGVLRVGGLVTDLVLTARLDPEQQVDQFDLISSFGELTLMLDVRDSVTGESLLRTVDREPIARDPVAGAVVNSTGANLSAQRLLFARQAQLLHERLDELRAMGRAPEPPSAPVPAPAATRRQGRQP